MKLRKVPRRELTRELLGMEERDVVGYLAGRNFIGYDTGHVWLTEAGVQLLTRRGLCRQPKGMPGRPNHDELLKRAALFMEALHDEVGGVDDPNRDAEIGELASIAGIEHDNDVYYVVIELLKDRSGYVAQGHSISSVRMTTHGLAFVEERRDRPAFER